MNTPKYLIQNVEKYPNEPALSIKDSSGNWKTDTWSEVYSSVLSVSKSLLACVILKNMIRLAFIVTTDLNGI